MHWTKPPSESYAKLARWGFNSVLLYISWANVENRRPTKVGGHLRHHYNRGYLRALSSVVHAYSSRGIKVILAMGNNRWSSAFTNLTLPNGMHVKCGSGAPAWLYSRSSNIRHMVNAENSFFHSSKLIGWFARAWKVVAHRFARNRGVIGADILHESYDLLAQPYPGSGGITPRTLHLAGFYERVGRAIHKANRHLLLLTADWRSWGRPRFFAITRRPRLSNAAETFEFYASNWSTSGRTRLRVYRRRANNWHRPAWAEEFFAFLPTSSTAAIRPSWRTSSKGFLTFTKKVKVGWAFAPYTRLATNDPPRLARVLKTGFCVGSLTC
jgi:hypothetical protein